MPGDSKEERLARIGQRVERHAKRAVAALKQVGPGRYVGAIEGVVLHGGGVEVVGHLARSDDPPDAILVRVNGKTICLATVEPESETNAREMPPGSEAATKPARWSALIPNNQLPDGDLRFDVAFVGRSDLVESLEPLLYPARGRIGPKPLQGMVDHPVEGLVARGGVIEVSGWVLDPRDIDYLEVIVDRTRIERARVLCMERDDVADRTGDPGNLLSGFRHSLDLGGFEQGSRHEVIVDAVGPTGRTHLGRRHFVVGPTARPLSDDDRRWIPTLAGRAAVAASASIPGDGLNLLVVTHDLDIGGAQLWLQQILLRLLSDWDVACTVICPQDGALRSELETAGARVHICGQFPGTFAAYESMVREIIDRAVHDSTSIVFANTADAFIGVDVALRCGLPSVHAIHEHFPAHIRAQNSFGIYGYDEHVISRRELALAEATAVGFVADATRHLYFPAEGPGRALTVDYGISMEEVDAARARLDRDHLRRDHGFLPSDCVLVCVASINPRKAQSSLVMAMSRMAADRPGVQLVMVGASDDPYCAAVATLADALGLARRVRLVPVTDDVTPWWVMADGFVLASDVESLPRSIIEAMAFEVPVVATDVGGVSELVVDGKTGFLVAPNDIPELTRALRRLVDADPDALAAMTQRASRVVRETRDGSRYTGAFIRLLRGLAKDPGASPALLVAGD